jgi:twitching motility protein PilT
MNRVDPQSIASFLAYVNQQDGTDIHLSVGAPPLVRRDGVLSPMPGEPALDAFSLEALITSLL